METTDKMIKRVQALIAKAEGTDNQHEREVYFAKAHELMAQHSISEAILDAQRPADQRAQPETLRIHICDRKTNPVVDALTDLMSYLAWFHDCKLVFYGLHQKSYTTQVDAVLVGYPTNLRSLELMFTTLHLDLASQLEPKPNPAKGFDENVHDLHEAGVKWRRIAELMNDTYLIYREANQQNPAALTLMDDWRKAVRQNKDQPNLLVPWPDGHRLINAYRRHCKKIGAEPRAIQSPVTYQRNFAAGYTLRINSRLIDIKWKAESAASPGTALALRSEAVDEKFNEMFPDLGTIKRKEHRVIAEARAAGRRAADKADLSRDSGVPNATRGALS